MKFWTFAILGILYCIVMTDLANLTWKPREASSMAGGGGKLEGDGSPLVSMAGGGGGG